MSEDALRRLLERANSDDAFREMLTNDPEAALEDFELSPTETVALAAGDEEALRRLAGLETAAFAQFAGIGRAMATVTTNTVATYPDGWTKAAAAASPGRGSAVARGGTPEVMGFCFAC